LQGGHVGDGRCPYHNTRYVRESPGSGEGKRAGVGCEELIDIPYEEGGGLDTEPRALCEDVGSGFEVGVTAWAGVLRWEEPGSMLADGRVVEDGPRCSSA